MRPLRYVVLVCLLPCLLYSIPDKIASDTLRATTHWKSAQTFYRNGVYDSALVHSENALAGFEAVIAKKHSARMVARMLECRGLYSKSLIRLRKFDEALASIHKAEESIARFQKTMTLANADIHVCYGSWYMGRNEFDKAIGSFQQAISVYRAVDGDSSILIARVYDLLGAAFHSKGNYAQSLDYLDKSARIIILKKGEDSVEFGENCAIVSAVLYDKGEYEKATTIAERSLTLRKKYLGNKHRQVYESCLRMGVCWYARGEYDRATRYYDEGAEIVRELYGEKNAMMAQYWNNCGIINFERGYFDRALDNFSLGLDLKRQTLAANDPSIANSYNNVGNVYYMRGDFDQALEYYRKALDIRIASLKANHPSIAGSYQKMGSAYQMRGDLDRALEYFDRSLAISMNAYSEHHVEVTRCYEMMSSLYSQKDDLPTALTYAKKALAIDRKVLGEKHPLIATRYNKVGDIFKSTARYDSALFYYKKGLDMMAARQGDTHYLVGYAHQDLGDLYLANKEPVLAQEEYNRAESLLTNTFGPSFPALTVIDLQRARIYIDAKDWDKAFARYQVALARLQKDFHADHYAENPQTSLGLARRPIIDVLAAKSKALEDYYYHVSKNQKDLEACLETCETLIACLERLLGQYEATESKLDLLEEAHHSFSRAVRSALQLYASTKNDRFLERGLLCCEKAKSAILWQLVQETKAHTFAGIPDSMLAKEREARADIAFFETRQRKELEKGAKKDSARLREYTDKLFEASERYQNLRNSFVHTFPEYAGLFSTTHSPDLTSLQKALDERSAVLDYYVDADKSVYCFLITQDHLHGYVMPVDSAFSRRTKDLDRSIRKMDKRLFVDASSRLYKQILQPMVKNLAGKDHLIVIPHGVLYKVPFEVLLQHPAKVANADYAGLDYLIHSCAVTYHYSAALYQHSRQNNPANSATYDGDFVGFAPVFRDSIAIAPMLAELVSREQNDSTLRSVSIDGHRFNELTYSENEIENIRDLFLHHGKKAAIYSYGQATESQFKRAAGRDRFVHVATHGIMNENVPQLSGLIFSPEPAQKEDGVLYSAETFNLDLDAELLVLSSCESGIGKLVAGEGLMSVTRGLIYSGAHRVMVSLWKVSDRHTRDFMTDFYRGFLGGESFPAAVRLAKRRMARNPATAAPLLWSGFVLIGE
jgi:CHAT domain-containing protein/Tfp pilus assembly protein PilF